MPATIVIGTQWGDEGKGKCIDYLSKDADIIVRFQGGNNAGHTIVHDGKTFKLHLVPSGVIRGKEVMMGNGMVIDPQHLLDEILSLEQQGIKVDRLTISDRANVITQRHRELDGQDTKIGTTKRGIGPAYTDKISRKGVRICDIISDFPSLAKYVGDVSLKLNKALDSGKHVLFEGAQGTLLDVDFGTYPYVTSSNTIAGGACTGTGVGPTKISNVVGVVKAYTTRVGEGPFPTELKDNIGEYLQTKGGEFGTTTGRKRRCGWLDLVLVNYSIRVSGISEIALTKIDVLDGLNEIKICTGYELDGKKIETLPARIEDFARCKPVYKTLPGWGVMKPDEWKKALSSGFKALPEKIRNYIKFIEDFTKTPVKLVSYGPSRNDTFPLK